jgi:DNA-binding MarR family transcriptional regulator
MYEDQESLRTAAVVRRGTVRLSRRLRAVRSPGALSGAKVSVLGHLHRQGPSSPGAIAAADQARPQALTRVFAELEEDGLIERAPSPHDGRGALLSLTRTGVEVLLADMAERDRWLADALGTLSETEVEVLRLAGLLMDRLADLDLPAVDR